MRYFINPNAAPKELYGLVPTLLALGNDVTLWEPHERDIDLYINGSILFGALAPERPSGIGRLSLFSSPSRLRAYRDPGLPFSSDRNRIVDAIGRNLQSADFKEGSATYSKRVWASMSEEIRDEVKGAMDAMLRDFQAQRSTYSDRFLEQGSKSGMGVEWALFNSVAQDAFMLMRTRSSTPLVRAQRWKPYVKALQHLDLIALSDRLSLGEEDSFKRTDLLIEHLNVQSPEERGEGRILRLANEVYRLQNLSFAEFSTVINDLSKDIQTFREVEQSIVRDVSLNGSDSVTKSACLQNRIEDRRRAVQRFVEFWGGPLPQLASTAAGLGTKSDWGIAASVIFGLTGSIAFVHKESLAEFYSALGLPKSLRSRRHRLFLRDSAFWSAFMREVSASPA